MILAALLVAACRPPDPPDGADSADAAGLDFTQLFAGNEWLEDGGVLEGRGVLYLYLDVVEGPLSGQVFTDGGDITVDGRDIPEGRAVVVEGQAWWEDDDCFAAWFYAPAADALQATARGCRLDLSLDVEVGVEAIEERFSMTASYEYDPFFDPR